MKEQHDFQLIESQPINYQRPGFGAEYFQDDKNDYQAPQLMHKEPSQELGDKTPVSKKSRKFSVKNNPEDIGTPKTIKAKQKKYKSMLPDKQKNPNQLFGHWSTEENKRYHWFLQIHHSHFMNRSLRRMDRIFTSMAKFVETRQAQQCRSHHQKMQKKYKTFPKILLSLRYNHYSSNDEALLKDDIQNTEIAAKQFDTVEEELLTEDFLIQNQATLSEPIIREGLISPLNSSQGIAQPFQGKKRTQGIYNRSGFKKQASKSSREQAKQNWHLDLEEEQKQQNYEGLTHRINFQDQNIEVDSNPVQQDDLMMDDIVGPDLESSKNYFGKFQNQAGNLFGDHFGNEQQMNINESLNNFAQQSSLL